MSGWRYVVAASPMRPIEEEKKRTNKWKPKSESTTLASFGANVFSWRCTLRVEIYTSVRFAAEKKANLFAKKLPNLVVGSHADPLGHGSVGVLLFGENLLDSKGLVSGLDDFGFRNLSLFEKQTKQQR